MIHSGLTGKGRGGVENVVDFFDFFFIFGIDLGQNPYVPFWPILKQFFGPLGPLFGSKMGQNGLKCHLCGPDGPKRLEQGGTRLEQDRGH